MIFLYGRAAAAGLHLLTSPFCLVTSDVSQPSVTQDGVMKSRSIVTQTSRISAAR